MSLKRFCIEQLCPSIDSMISLVFCRLSHYVIVNLNVNENHVQYVHRVMDDPPRVTQYTVRELSYRKHKNWEKKSLKIDVKRHSTSAGITFDQRERAIGMLTAGMSARDMVGVEGKRGDWANYRNLEILNCASPIFPSV